MGLFLYFFLFISILLKVKCSFFGAKHVLDEKHKKIHKRDNELKLGIATFYDQSSSIWLEVWGEHMHHGYYDSPYDDHKMAQIKMIEKSLNFGFENDVMREKGHSKFLLGYNNKKMFPPSSFIDIGCGVGGSTRYISKKYNCSGIGVSLSPLQINKAKGLSKESFYKKIDFEVADALNLPFKDNSFDLGILKSYKLSFRFL